MQKPVEDVLVAEISLEAELGDAGEVSIDVVAGLEVAPLIGKVVVVTHREIVVDRVQSVRSAGVVQGILPVSAIY